MTTNYLRVQKYDETIGYVFVEPGDSVERVFAAVRRLQQSAPGSHVVAFKPLPYMPSDFRCVGVNHE